MKILDALVDNLRILDIDTVFGIPGIHNLALFDAFDKAHFNIVVATHEQGAAFMADGYARSTGRMAVVAVIDGPGFLNAATAVGQAYADSIPMLLVTPELPSSCSMNGRLHELNNQLDIARQICGRAYQIDTANCLSAAFADITTELEHSRLRPFHIQIPLDRLDSDLKFEELDLPVSAQPSSIDQKLAEKASSLMSTATKPIVLCGGGAIDARQEVRNVVEQLDAPCLNTVHGKGVLPTDHPLHVGGSPSLPCLQQALCDADVVLAVGTEFGETDFGFFLDHQMPQLQQLIRIDIDKTQLFKNQKPSIALHGDAATVLAAMVIKPKLGNGAQRASSLRAAIAQERFVDPDYRAFLKCLTDQSDIVVGDSCQPTYHASWSAETSEPRSYFHSVTGFGTLGYALPAAIGAKVANPEKRVTAVIGDGGLLYTLSEIATAVRNDTGLALLVWNNDGFNEIEKAAIASAESYRCPALQALDYASIAEGFRAAYAHPRSLSELQASLAEAHQRQQPTLIHVEEQDMITSNVGNWYL